MSPHPSNPIHPITSFLHSVLSAGSWPVWAKSVDISSDHQCPPEWPRVSGPQPGWHPPCHRLQAGTHHHRQYGASWGIIGHHRELWSITGNYGHHWAYMAITGHYRASLGINGHHGALLGITSIMGIMTWHMHWALWSIRGVVVHGALQGIVEHYRTPLGIIWSWDITRHCDSSLAL